jgi:hypothetical protein
MSTPSEDDIAEFEKALPGVAGNARSLDEIEAWIRAQPCVRSVELAAHILKSNPPQRDFIIECGTKDGATVRKVLNVFVLSGEKFQFSGMRDE